MKKTTRLFLMLTVCLCSMGVANAEKLFATYGVPANEGNWNAETETYSWTQSYSNLMPIFTFSDGELADYKSIHLTTSDYTDTYRICFMNGSTLVATIAFYSAGQKDLAFSERNETKDLDLSQITHISFGGNSGSGSIKLSNVYLEKPDAPKEIEYSQGASLNINDVLNDNMLVSIGTPDGSILYGNNKDNQIYLSAITSVMDIIEQSEGCGSYQFRVRVATDEGITMPSGVTTLYRIQAYKPDGTSVYTGPWYGGDCYLNDIGWTRNVVPLGDGGEDGCLFSIEPIEGKENTYKINSYKKDGSLTTANIYGKEEWVFHVLSEVEVPEKKIVASNDEIFNMSKFVDGGWTFDTPVDLYDWSYLVICTEVTAANASHEVTITDASGASLGGNAYNGEAAKTGAGMWLDYWNSQNVLCIDLNVVRTVNKIDVFHIKSLKISGDIKPSVVYLTDYVHPKLANRGRWELYVAGDAVRNYSETGKFGTVCLPYVASFSGAEVYSIAGTDGKSISLEKVTGLLEAGKPYIFQAVDENGHDNAGTERNVNFFKADIDDYDVAEPLSANGLVGTFTGGTVPADCYVLSENKLKKVIVGNEPTAGANRAWLDLSQVSSASGVKGDIRLSFDDVTGISSVSSDIQSLQNNVLYDLSGRQVKNPARGLYILNGKKVIIK